jgi:hypothetical protein
MYADKKVIVVIPAGRKRYLEILLPYLYHHPIVDECQLWLNTDIEDDIQFIRSLQDDFFQVIEYEYKDEKSISIERCFNFPQIERNFGARLAIGKFLSLAPNDRNIIYLRLDDDICFIEKNAIFNLIRFRYNNPDYFLVYGNIINNSRISHYHQSLCNKLSGLPNDGDVRNSWEALEVLHREFIAHIVSNRVSEYFFEDVELTRNEHTGIQCISYFADDAFKLYNLLNFYQIQHEELALSCEYPSIVGKINAICGNAVFCHFSYFPTRLEIEKNTNLLEEYMRISKGER